MLVTRKDWTDKIRRRAARNGYAQAIAQLAKDSSFDEHTDAPKVSTWTRLKTRLFGGRGLAGIILVLLRVIGVIHWPCWEAALPPARTE
jgi:hypothetical protein